MNWSVEVAEFMAIREGLLVGQRMDIVVRVIKCDSYNIIRDINGTLPLSPHPPVIVEIRLLLSSVSVDSGICRFILRCTNKVVHSLATFISSLFTLYK